MQILIAGGTGFIGSFMVNRYLQNNHKVTIIGRSVDKIQQIFSPAVIPLSWEQFNKNAKQILKSMDLVINLGGAGIADRRWSPARKKILIESRVSMTKQIVDAYLKLDEPALGPVLFNASAVSVYGIQPPVEKGLPFPMDEETVIDFNNYPDFATKITRLWEKETHRARDAGVRVINCRFATVLGPHGGALKKLSLPFYFFLGGQLGSGKQPFPWISLVDLCEAIDFVFAKKEISGPVNFVSSNCVTHQEFIQVLGKVLKRPAFLKIPAFFMELLWGQMAQELLLNGQHIKPKVLLENGYPFVHASLFDALAFATRN